jgi:hypothetical protein
LVLGGAEPPVAADLVQGARARGDVDQGTVEMDVGSGQAGQLAEAHTGVRGGDDQRADVKVGHPGSQAPSLFRGCGGAGLAGPIA